MNNDTNIPSLEIKSTRITAQAVLNRFNGINSESVSARTSAARASNKDDWRGRSNARPLQIVRR